MRNVNLKRRETIAKIVFSEEEVKVKDLSERLQVSDETIRKDLTALELLGILNKTHGGAKLVIKENQLPMDVKLKENLNDKRLVARKALDFIEDNMTIFLDAGSTTVQLAKMLGMRKNLIVITNSLVVANIVSQTNNTVICTGGFIQEKGKAMLGFIANDAIERFHIDISIIGSDGIKGMRGITTFTAEEVDIRKSIRRVSKKNIVIFDASKFHKTAIYEIAPFKDFDYIITNYQKGIDYRVIDNPNLILVKENEL